MFESVDTINKSSTFFIQEEAAKEEQLAMQKIAATLADLTTKRVAIVSYPTHS